MTIIGVIAALTIPTLMKNYEKRQIEVGLAKTYQELSNVMKRSEIDNGPFEDWNFEHTVRDADTKKYIDKYFAPYMRLKQCTNDCFSGKYGGGYFSGYMLANGSIASNISATYLLPDGRTIQFDSFIIYDTGHYININVDVNGKRGKSKIGEDVFAFVMGYSPKRMKKGFYTGGMYGGYGCFGISNETAYKECKNSPLNCSVILQRNNWQFPDDYPIKF